MNQQPTPPHHRLINLERDLSGDLPRPLLKLMSRPVEKILSFDAVNDLYEETKRNVAKNHPFFTAAAEAFGFQTVIPPDDLKRVPTEGPLIVVANHPFGGVDAIALGNLLLSVRPDLKMMANSLLSQMPETNEWFIPVDPFGGKGAARRNLQSMKQAMAWLTAGHVLSVFPAGEVSHWRWPQKKVEDPPWTTHVAAMARKTGATVLPVFIAGRNSLFFQAAGMLHPRLRTLLLPGELEKMRAEKIHIFIGRPVPPRALQNLESDAQITQYLRSATYFLKTRTFRQPLEKMESKTSEETPVVPGQTKQALRSDIQQLGPEHLLHRQGRYSVYAARAFELPHILPEIGRLREITFRGVGEGTGKAIDLDSYDYRYLHLFLWDEAEDQIVGSYRIGQTDLILPREGARGLYTASLFRFQPTFLKLLDPALELGRSFIISEYQKSYHGLMMLWRGIGEFIARNPRYYRLIGPVSITSDYHPLSQRLLIRFLSENVRDESWARLVRAKKPPKHLRFMGLTRTEVSSLMNNVEDVSSLNSILEKDSKGVPVLIRHYLKMNARLLSFNIDPEFSDVLDGLMLLDLRKSDPKMLRRFMGEDGYATFQQIHGEDEPISHR